MTNLPPGDEPAMPPDDALLADAFAALRAGAPVPSAALMDRVLADAATLQPRPPRAPAQDSVTPLARVPRHRTALADLVSLLGGWRGLGGMATAAAAGVWIGVAGSAAGFGLPALSGQDDLAVAGTVVELLPGADSFGVAGVAGGEL